MAKTGARRALNVIVTALAVAALGLAALMLVPAALGMDRYVITGASMSGTFEKGSLVYERKVPVTQLKVGDVITYLPPHDSGVTELVTHRIVEVSPGPAGAASPLIRTKGDANASVDPWTFVLSGAVQPKVEAVVPGVGWLFIALADRYLRMLVIGIPAAIVALLSLGDLVAAARRPRARRAPARVEPVLAEDGAVMPETGSVGPEATPVS
jgi:signal peptidase I